MATTLRAQHAAGPSGGVDVLIDVAGRGVTLSFPSPPSDAELAAVIEACEQRMAAEDVAAEIEANMQEVLA